jgi:Aldo/keto reductase family
LWANGGPINTLNERHMRDLLMAMRALDRGTARENRALLLAPLRDGNSTIGDLLRGQHFDDAIARIGRGRGRVVSPVTHEAAWEPEKLSVADRLGTNADRMERERREMEFVTISETSLRLSRVGLGTWAIGGWMWGGTDEGESVKTIQSAVERGINLIDTAPAYGFGRSEEIVGRAMAEGQLRSSVAIATKTGLEWRDGKVFRNASRDQILREATDSLRRLRTDYIDIYQVHWRDPLVPIEETAEAMQTLLNQGKIRAIGVSNFSIRQIERFRRVAKLHVVQPPYNLF